MGPLVDITQACGTSRQLPCSLRGQAIHALSATSPSSQHGWRPTQNEGLISEAGLADEAAAGACQAAANAQKLEASLADEAAAGARQAAANAQK